ncbi:hypothetical protein TorRG33x02_142930 [Trema orientale]|uniref:Uncharacterized protein n=1 Tax=Trema orientale TaxID=63057 RepID=A0A2P5EWT7_TREOI|nr:hypothetical protein TorRG33x02_142930 [Trema orientale]
MVRLRIRGKKLVGIEAIKPHDSLHKKPWLTKLDLCHSHQLPEQVFQVILSHDLGTSTGRLQDISPGIMSKCPHETLQSYNF